MKPYQWILLGLVLCMPPLWPILAVIYGYAHAWRKDLPPHKRRSRLVIVL